MADLTPPQLRKEKHVTYWLRCLKTYLPHHYTSMDPSRMSLAFFIVSALDLLDALNNHTTPEERQGYVDWIYRCQHPNGGFRGFPGTDFGSLSSSENAVWDPANLAATYFAIGMLLIFRDDLKRLKREACLEWMATLQRPDGSFGQTIGLDASIEGGNDTRFGYVALCIRWFLGDLNLSDKAEHQDPSITNLSQRISQLQTYDGGFSDLPFHEAHGGYTYCAVGALSMAGTMDTSIQDRDLLIHFLVSRQTSLMHLEDDDTDGGSGKDEEDHVSAESYAGFNGRCNKPADTCYAWWIGATLKTLRHVDLIDTKAVTCFLLDHTQHTIGGFGKFAGEPPDIYHSYLGLAALAILDYPGLKPIHPAACISMDALTGRSEG